MKELFEAIDAGKYDTILLIAAVILIFVCTVIREEV